MINKHKHTSAQGRRRTSERARTHTERETETEIEREGEPFSQLLHVGIDPVGCKFHSSLWQQKPLETNKYGKQSSNKKHPHTNLRQLALLECQKKGCFPTHQ